MSPTRYALLLAALATLALIGCADDPDPTPQAPSNSAVVADVGDDTSDRRDTDEPDTDEPDAPMEDTADDAEPDLPTIDAPENPFDPPSPDPVFITVAKLPEVLNGAIPFDGEAPFRHSLNRTALTLDLWLDGVAVDAVSVACSFDLTTPQGEDVPAGEGIDGTRFRPDGRAWFTMRFTAENPLPATEAATCTATLEREGSTLESTVNFDLIDPDPAFDPFPYIDRWHLDLARDLNGYAVDTLADGTVVFLPVTGPNGVPDFDDAMVALGLFDPGAFEATRFVRAWLRSRLRDKVEACFKVNADEPPPIKISLTGDPVAHRSTGTPSRPRTPSTASLLAVGGASADTDVWSSAVGDVANQRAEDNTSIDRGVFVSNIVAAALASQRALAFLAPTLPGRGVPVTNADLRPTDQLVRDNDLNGEERARRKAIEQVVEVVTTFVAIPVCHAIGHSIGAATPGLPPEGLLAGVEGPAFIGPRVDADHSHVGNDVMAAAPTVEDALRWLVEPPRFHPLAEAWMARAITVAPPSLEPRQDAPDDNEGEPNDDAGRASALGASVSGALSADRPSPRLDLATDRDLFWLDHPQGTSVVVTITFDQAPPVPVELSLDTTDAADALPFLDVSRTTTDAQTTFTLHLTDDARYILAMTAPNLPVDLDYTITADVIDIDPAAQALPYEATGVVPDGAAPVIALTAEDDTVFEIAWDTTNPSAYNAFGFTDAAGRRVGGGPNADIARLHVPAGQTAHAVLNAGLFDPDASFDVTIRGLDPAAAIEPNAVFGGAWPLPPGEPGSPNVVESALEVPVDSPEFDCYALGWIEAGEAVRLVAAPTGDSPALPSIAVSSLAAEATVFYGGASTSPALERRASLTIVAPTSRRFFACVREATNDEPGVRNGGADWTYSLSAERVEATPLTLDADNPLDIDLAFGQTATIDITAAPPRAGVWLIRGVGAEDAPRSLVTQAEGTNQTIDAPFTGTYADDLRRLDYVATSAGPLRVNAWHDLPWLSEATTLDYTLGFLPIESLDEIEDHPDSQADADLFPALAAWSIEGSVADNDIDVFRFTIPPDPILFLAIDRWGDDADDQADTIISINLPNLGAFTSDDFNSRHGILISSTPIDTTGEALVIVRPFCGTYYCTSGRYRLLMMLASASDEP